MGTGKIMSEQNDGPSNRICLLIVDDEEGFVNVIANRLGRRGIDATKALSGTEAIQLLRKKDFDVAVLYLKMEDMNSIEVLKIFKKMVPEMPIIMLTGHGCEQAAREGIEQGAVDYFGKPCELQELVRKIQEVVSKGR